LSKKEFIFKKHEKMSKNSGQEIYKCGFNLNKNCLIQSLNQLSGNQENNVFDSLSDDSSFSLSKNSSLQSSFNSLLFEPYLDKFEEENLMNTKSNMVKNLSAKYLRTDNENYELLKSTEHLIPFENISPKSVESLLDFVIVNKTQLLDDNLQADFDVYNKKGNVISNRKVKRWVSILKDKYLLKIILKKHTARQINDLIIYDNRNELILPINDSSEQGSNRVRLHSNEEVFDEATDDSYLTDSSESSCFTEFSFKMPERCKVQYTKMNKKPDLKEIEQKSPEKRMLYKDWFELVKKIQKDPNFDLETFVS